MVSVRSSPRWGVPVSASETRSNTLERKPSMYCAWNVSTPVETLPPLSPTTWETAMRVSLEALYLRSPFSPV